MTRTAWEADWASDPAVPFQIGTQLTLGQGRYWSLLVFYSGLALVYVPWLSAGQSLGKVLVGLGLLLAFLLAPMEYALGGLAFGFLAAACVHLHQTFLLWRWFVLGGAAGTLALRFFFRRRRWRRPGLNRFDCLMALFVVVACSSILSSVSMGMSSLKLAAFVGVVWLSAQGGAHLAETYGPAAPRRLAYGLLAYCGGILALAIASYLLPGGSPAGGGAWFAGYLGHPNAWALLVMTALPWVASPLLRHRHWNGQLLALGGAVILLAYSLFLSGSRAAILGTVLAVSLAGLVHGSRWVAAAILLMSVAFTVRAVVEPDFLPRFTSRYIWKQGQKVYTPLAQWGRALQSRETPWRLTRQQFERHPWLGLGFGVSTEAQANWSLGLETGANILETGSSFWGTLSQVGILGTAALGLAILTLLWRGFRFAWLVRDPWFTAIYTSVAALTVNAVFEGWLLAPGNFASTYYWLQCFLLNAVMCRFRPLP